MKRQIIEIDEAKCNGCGLCVPNCHEGALQIIDGKARLISELMCDGLGACLGHCPEGAITVVEREAQPYDEVVVMTAMAGKGKNTVRAHLQHLKDHGEKGYLAQGLQYLVDHAGEMDFEVDEVLRQVIHGDVPVPADHKQPVHEYPAAPGSCGCPGSQSRVFASPASTDDRAALPAMTPSSLTHWPVQMHLINPAAAHFRQSDLLLTADCVAFALGDFHRRFLKGKTLTIACPKLDSNTEVYVEKLITLIDQAKVNTITVMKMEVPCCSGLLQMARVAVSHAGHKVPLKSVTVGIQGEILEESWV